VSARTVAFATLGCRLNQVDSQEMMALVERAGFRLAREGERADLCVVNTCTVTDRADVSDRQTIRRIGRKNPGGLLIVTGCYAQTSPEAVARIPGVDLVLGNREKSRLVEHLESLVRSREAQVRVGDVRAARDVPRPAATRVFGRSRAFVKVQDGCQHRCAFCIVPAARGGSRSQDPAVVVEQVGALVRAGYGEVTLTGVDLGHYGWDLSPRMTLAGLIRRIATVPGLRWVRLSSVLPAYFTDDLIEVVSQPPVAPHLHVPLQSGSDRVLRLMRRPYGVAMYRRTVERLSRAIPDLGLGTDLIAGHPGEDERDFLETVAVVCDLPFTYLHVFPYSERRGIEAGRIAGRPPARVVHERSRHLREVARRKSRAFRRGLVGRSREALVLGTRDRDTGRLTALTDNYVEVLVDGPDALAHRFVVVTVQAALPGRTLGTLRELPA
jgi:threonylcarbamoyladenosine tRNA methylthiotransferase MtaB